MSGIEEGSPKKSADPRRPFTESASEFFALLGFVLFFATVITVAVHASAGDPFDILAATVRSAAEAGKYVLSPYYEFLMALAGILLGLFALSVGGQIFGPAGSAEQTRRILGWAGEALAVLAYLPFAFVITYCFTEPAAWASMLLLLPEMVVVTFLALQLASFVVWEPALQRANALAAIERVNRISLVIPMASRRPVPGVIAINAGLVGAIVACVAAPGSSPILWAVLVVGGIIITALSSFLNVLMGETAFTTASRIGRRAALAWIVISATLLTLFFLPIAPPLSIAWTVRLVIALSLLVPAASAVLPLDRAAFLHQWTLRAASAKLARRSLGKTRVRADATIARLDASGTASELGGAERLRGLLRRLLGINAKPSQP